MMIQLLNRQAGPGDLFAVTSGVIMMSSWSVLVLLGITRLDGLRVTCPCPVQPIHISKNTLVRLCSNV